MAWYDEAVFYHIYPLGLVGAPKQNDYGEPVHRLNTLLPWIEHIKRLGFTALYIGPLFESVGHGYETTDYKKLDSRLGTNDDLVAFVRACHDAGIKVVFDGVFNHTGRDFFAFRDLRQNREGSPYRDWYCNVNFWGNNEYNDGFSYDNWGGYNLLAKLNQRNPAVRDYICDVIRFWVDAFDVDGIRLDAADVLDFDFMKALRRTADEVKPDFWLMGEVIHGDYSRWANERTLHSVTDYALHKALYSAHNDHNYFEIAHTVRRTNGMVPAHIRLYKFVDNHDVERISTKLRNKAHYLPVHILLYTLPGIPSVYYGSEFGIEGKKERFSDDSLRPHLELADYADAYETNPCTMLTAELGRIHAEYKDDLVWGAYRELSLTTEQYAYARGRLVVALNNAEHKAVVKVRAQAPGYVGLLSGKTITAKDGHLRISLPPCGGDIFAPLDDKDAIRAAKDAERRATKRANAKAAGANDKNPAENPKDLVENGEAPKVPATGSTPSPAPSPAAGPAPDLAPSPAPDLAPVQLVDSFVARAKEQKATDASTPTAALPKDIPNVPYEEMTVEQLQAVILSKMAKNGPVTDRMAKDVTDNIWKNSLINWAKSFR